MSPAPQESISIRLTCNPLTPTLLSLRADPDKAGRARYMVKVQQLTTISIVRSNAQSQQINSLQRFHNPRLTEHFLFHYRAPPRQIQKVYKINVRDGMNQLANKVRVMTQFKANSRYTCEQPEPQLQLLALLDLYALQVKR